MGRLIAALDIGGTSVKSGIWDGDRLMDIREQDTNAKLGGTHVMELAKEILRGYAASADTGSAPDSKIPADTGSALDSKNPADTGGAPDSKIPADNKSTPDMTAPAVCRFSAIGISTAGQVDSARGCIRYANENIPGYTGMDIRGILEKEFGVPVAVENDVNAAAVGEARFGAGADQKDFLCITYGTGVGGAIVMDREIYTGSAYSAGEFGGIVVHPEDRVKGRPFSGCYEKYASTTGLVRMARQYDAGLDNGRKIFSRIDEPEVKAVVDRWIDEIVCGLVSVIHIFNPSCIVLGGGVMAQAYVQEQVCERVRTEIMDSFRNVELRQAALGNQAGILGAAYLASQLQERTHK